MFNPFKKKTQPTGEAIFAPVSGSRLALADVPDPVFASGTVGPGFAIDTASDNISAPVAGELVLLADTGHAFAIKTATGLEVLVHIGVDTVTLKGAGFTAQRAVGDHVNIGDVIIVCDTAAVAPQVPSLATIVVVTNGAEFTLSEPDLAASEGPVVTAQRT